MPTGEAQYHIKGNTDSTTTHQDNPLYGIAHYNLKPLKEQQWFKHLESVLSAIIQQYSWVLHQMKTNKLKNFLHKHFLTWGSSKSSFNRWKGYVPSLHQSSLIGLCASPASVLPNLSFNRRSREATPGGCAPPRLLSRGTVFPENPVRTAVLWLGSWQPCGRRSGRNGTSWAGVVTCTLWRGGPGLRSCSTYKSREHLVRCDVCINLQ